MKRKILLYLSFALLLVALLSLSISAQEPVKSWDISASGSSVVAKLYNDTENSGNYSLVISGEGNMKNWAYNSFAPWYTLYSDKITSVTIEEGVTNVGNFAFWHFSTLKNIVIPKGVTKIGDSSFIDCSNLKKILLPESLISIGEYAFRNSGLGFAIIPDSVTTIGQYAFYESDMDYVIIGSGVEKIGNYAFSRVSATIYAQAPSKPDSWSTYWDNANNYGTVWGTDGGALENGLVWIRYADGELEIKDSTENVSNIVIPSSINGYSVTTIGDDAFSDCTALTSIVIPDSVTTIGYSAFYYCSSLTSIVIPDSVTSIGGGAFRYCYSLTSVVIPDSVTTIGEYAFYDCTSLTIYAEAQSEPSGWN